MRFESIGFFIREYSHRSSRQRRRLVRRIYIEIAHVHREKNKRNNRLIGLASKTIIKDDDLNWHYETRTIDKFFSYFPVCLAALAKFKPTAELKKSFSVVSKKKKIWRFFTFVRAQQWSAVKVCQVTSDSCDIFPKMIDSVRRASSIAHAFRKNFFNWFDGILIDVRILK